MPIAHSKLARGAGVKFNPTLPTETISNALDALTRDRSAMSLEAANREVYQLVKERVTVSVPNRQMLCHYYASLLWR